MSAADIEAIRARYKKSKTDAEQRQKMNMEMMQLYQKEGINPMAGCLPLVLRRSPRSAPLHAGA